MAKYLEKFPNTFIVTLNLFLGHHFVSSNKEKREKRNKNLQNTLKQSTIKATKFFSKLKNINLIFLNYNFRKSSKGNKEME